MDRRTVIPCYSTHHTQAWRYRGLWTDGQSYLAITHSIIRPGGTEGCAPTLRGPGIHHRPSKAPLFYFPPLCALQSTAISWTVEQTGEWTGEEKLKCAPLYSELCVHLKPSLSCLYVNFERSFCLRFSPVSLYQGLERFNCSFLEMKQ